MPFWATSEYSPAAFACQTSTCAPATGAQSAVASNTYMVSASGAPGCSPDPSLLARMSERFSASSTKYGPSVFSGVMTQVADAASATSPAAPPRSGPANRRATPPAPAASAWRRVRGRSEEGMAPVSARSLGAA